MSENKNKIQLPEQTLFNDLAQLIEHSKKLVVVQANSVMTMLFWNVDKRINEDILQNKRANYGKQIVATLAQQLTEKYGKSFEARNLRRMMQFAEQFPDFEIVDAFCGTYAAERRKSPPVLRQRSSRKALGKARPFSAIYVEGVERHRVV